MADQNVPGSNPPFDAIYNPSGFDGQVTSDFMRLGGIPEALKKDLIDFSVSDFDTFKVRLLEYVKSVYPEDYNNFAESDLGVMLVELVAYMSSVLSFKADAIAQENYIATAKTANSVTKLLELIGVSLRGPVSSKAGCRLTLQDTKYALSGMDSFTIKASDRVFETDSTRDTLPLSYTLYKVGPNGDVDMLGESVSLAALESVDDAGIVFDNLLLLEGKYQNQGGTFQRGVTNHVIDLKLPSVIEGSIIVSGADGIFTEVENIWFASAGDKVFEKRYNNNFSCRLIFGDGTTGHSPTPGTGYNAIFRTGGGQRGNIPSRHIQGQTNATQSRWLTEVPLSIVNTRAGTGGVDSQSIAEAKRMGPMWFATQYRAVTGKDYTTFANKFVSTFGTTGKGLAVLRDNGSAGNMIDIYILEKATENHVARASFEFKRELLAYLNQYKMLTDELTVVDGVVRTLDLVCTLYIDRTQKLTSEDVKQRVSASMVEYFSTVNMDFGTPLKIADLTNFVLRNAGARFFSVDNYSGDIYTSFNELLQLNNIEINVQFV